MTAKGLENSSQKHERQPNSWLFVHWSDALATELQVRCWRVRSYLLVHLYTHVLQTAKISNAERVLCDDKESRVMVNVECNVHYLPPRQTEKAKKRSSVLDHGFQANWTLSKTNQVSFTGSKIYVSYKLSTPSRSLYHAMEFYFLSHDLGWWKPRDKTSR